ncbi:RodZ family helix-turn-helix domain-containing protein [Bacillus spongiae]|uniref:RodZ family helix-turn-helix domain-containing protein n=1 Tax=Bacillus spongiae TaxID=2683610 RepID=A0ABU8HAK1_9BACI
MTELGARLKAAREEKGFSLEDLQRKTKIQRRYLIGIEEGNYELMPGKFYVRAFIKQYAEAVDLHPEEIFDEYANEIPNVEANEIPQQLSRVSSRKKKVTDSTSKIVDIIPKLLVFIIIVGIAFLAWYLFQRYVDPSDNLSQKAAKDGAKDEIILEDNLAVEVTEEESTDGEAPSTDEESGDEEIINTPSQEIVVKGTLGVETTYELKNADAFNLELTALDEQNSWVTVYNGSDEILYDKSLANGDSLSYDLSNDTEAYLVIGYAPAVTITINGEPLSYEIDVNDEVVQKISIQYVKTE